MSIKLCSIMLIGVGWLFFDETSNCLFTQNLILILVANKYNC